MDEQLKSCPFCGGKFEIIRGMYYFKPICSKCNATAGAFDTEEEAIAAWQNRADGWIPIGKNTPEHCGLVLGYFNCGTYDVTFQRHDGRWHGDSEDGRVTHWQPLPEPPKKGE